MEMPYVAEPGLIEPLKADPPREPQPKLPPGKWIKKNLFNNWYNSGLTLVLGFVILSALVGVVRFVFFTGRWEPVIENLTLFMIGRFPRTEPNNELWRVVAQVIIWSGAMGLAWGAAVSGAKFRAMQAGIEYTEEKIFTRLRRYWSLIALVVLFLIIAETFGPALMVVAAVGFGVILQMIGSRVPGQYAGVLWAGVAFLGVFGYQIVSGFTGTGWIWLFLPIGMAAVSLIGMRDWDDPRRMHIIQTIVVIAILAVGFVVYAVTDFEGVGWDDWEGFHLNIIMAALAITLSFPLGLLLALARRSSFPALRTLATMYIELMRGVPLISLLLMAQFFLGFFLNTSTLPSLILRALVVMTMFTAAYVAEIVRGGLQAVPHGQVEAGNSIGLAPWKVTRLIVLPQALRAVIPAMVGQFISLFKDTTLLFIIGVGEILRVREQVHAQPDFRVVGIAETFVFVALAFWAISFAMSRESQRLEQKLGVGER